MKILEILTPKRLLGNFGERAARRYLRKHGYLIIGRNYVADSTEIDIIAERDGVRAFVEVKTRTYKEPSPITSRPAAAVNREKQRKIINCARIYNAKHYKECRSRFDVIEVYTEQVGIKTKVREIKHIIAAFDKSSAARYKK